MLKFGDTAQDYIRYKPDMQPFEREFTICAWIKNLRNEDYPNWFSYATSSEGKEISITDSGVDFYMFGEYSLLRSSYTVTPGSWFHNCVSWSAESQTRNVYIDGVLVDSKATPAGRTLGMGGYVVFGNEQDNYNNLADMDTDNMFSGEMFKLNVFSTMLPTSEIQEMASDICFDLENYGATRHIRWDDVIQLSRTGNVADITLERFCPIQFEERMLINLKQIEGKLNETLSQLASVTELKEQLDQTENKLNQIINELKHATTNSEKMGVKLEETLGELATATTERKEMFAQVNETLGELATATADREKMSAHLNETMGELATANADRKEMAAQMDKNLIELANATTDRKDMAVQLNRTVGVLVTALADSEEKALKLNETLVELETVRADSKQMAVRLNEIARELEKVKAEKWRL